MLMNVNGPPGRRRALKNRDVGVAPLRLRVGGTQSRSPTLGLGGSRPRRTTARPGQCRADPRLGRDHPFSFLWSIPSLAAGETLPWVGQFMPRTAQVPEHIVKFQTGEEPREEARDWLNHLRVVRNLEPFGPHSESYLRYGVPGNLV